MVAVLLLTLAGCDDEASRLEKQFAATGSGEFMERCRIARDLYKIYSRKNQLDKANDVWSRSWWECSQTNRVNGIAG